MGQWELIAKLERKKLPTDKQGVVPNDVLSEFRKVLVIDPYDKRVVDEGCWIDMVNKIICDEKFPLMSNFVDENFKPVKRKIA